VNGKLVPIVCVASPVICYLLVTYVPDVLNGYQIGFENLIINGLLVCLGLLLISRKSESHTVVDK